MAADGETVTHFPFSDRETTHTRERIPMQLKRNLLSAAIAALSFTGAAAQAQEPAPDSLTLSAQATELDAVKVTGIRRGIEASIDTKQSESTIVEAISAEDIGKLPDASIADSVARLPGLTAQRIGGRAQEINIRGFAGDFSTTLLNGREQVSMGNNRGVEFDQYPSELMSQVVVHKTNDARLVGQGLSGTVDLRTIRPLSFSERVISANLRGDMNRVDGDKDYGNRYTISYIDQFADHTLGLAVGYAHLDNPAQSKQFKSWGYGEKTDPASGLGFTQIGGGEVFAIRRDNTRDGMFATLEWKPTEAFSSTLDLFYSQFDQKEYKSGLQFGFGDGAPTAISDTGTALTGSAPVNTMLLRNDYTAYEDTLFSLGWRNELRIDDHWSLSTDLSYAKGKRKQPILETYGAIRPELTPTAHYAYDREGYYRFGFDFDANDPANYLLRDPGGWGGERAQAGYLKTFFTDDILTSVRLDLSRSFDTGAISALSFGANLGSRRKSRASSEFTLCVTADCTDNSGAPIPSHALGGRHIGLAGFDRATTLNPRTLLGSAYTRLGKDDVAIANKNWEVREDVATFYVQATIDTNLGQLPLRGNVGLQAVNVDQTSSGYQTYEGGSLSGERLEAGDHYLDWLPSMNLSLQLPAEHYLRFGAARQMARPRMDEMAVNSNITIDRTSGALPFWRQNGGNPRLKPWLANAYDLSYEKYFADNRGYFSAAYFYKDLKTYIYKQIGVFDIRDTLVPWQQYDVPGTLGQFERPVNGDGGTIKGLELAVSVPLDVLWSPLEGFGIVANYSDTRSSVQPLGPQFPDEPLPGLSKYVSNLTVYYERAGFSIRGSQRTRSKFLGEIQGDGSVGGNRQKVQFDGDKVVDFQVGYTFQDGPLQNLSLLFQVNNLTDEPYKRINEVSDRPDEYTAYGRTYLLGLSYKF